MNKLPVFNEEFFAYTSACWSPYTYNKFLSYPPLLYEGEEFNFADMEKVPDLFSLSDLEWFLYQLFPDPLCDDYAFDEWTCWHLQKDILEELGVDPGSLPPSAQQDYAREIAISYREIQQAIGCATGELKQRIFDHLKSHYSTAKWEGLLPERRIEELKLLVTA